MKKPIKQFVFENKEILKELSLKELFEFAQNHLLDTQQAFPRFKKALLEIGIDYNNIRKENKDKKEAEISKELSKEIFLYSDYKSSTNKFGICTKNQKIVWFGKDFDDPENQAQGELGAAKKAVWLAKKIKEFLGEKYLKLNLFVDAEWLTYQNNRKQKGYALTELAQKYGLILNVNWISGKSNPADYFTICEGFSKYDDFLNIENIDQFVKKLA